MNPTIEQFRSAILASGLSPPDEIIADGKLRRFGTNGRRGNDDAGWYVLHGDAIPAGAFGDWRSGIEQTWRADIGRKLTFAEAEALKRKADAARKQREAEQARARQEAQERARTLWKVAQPASEHPYLQRKQVKAFGLRVSNGRLLVPMLAAGELRSLQFIDADGEKRYLTDGLKNGCYHAIGKSNSVLCIAEGYATAASIHQATGHAVAVAFDAGNLEPVAVALRAKYPALRIVVCADDDYRTPGNPGLTKATAAARAASALLALPDFGTARPDGATDFNDAHVLLGADVVRGCIGAAKAPESPTSTVRAPEASEAQATPANAVASDSWPDPQPLVVDAERTPYPIDALPAGIREAVGEVVAFVQCPAALAACSALSVLSLAGQALADVRRATQLSGPVSLYFLAVADSGERKTTCDGHFLAPLQEWEREEAEKAKPELAQHAAAHGAWEEKRAGLRASIRDAAKRGERAEAEAAQTELAILEAECPSAPRISRLLYADTTPEALAWQIAHGWPSGGIMSSEAGIVFGGHGMSRDAVMRNLSLLNAFWDGIRVSVDRRQSESFKVEGARLTMGLAAQPDTVRTFMESTKGLARGNGFAARFLIAWPESTQGLRPFKEAGTWSHLPAFHRRLRELLACAPQLEQSGALVPPVLELDAEASKVWIQFHNDVEAELRHSGEMAEIRDVASKAADNAARLAALFHLYAHEATGSIGASSMSAAAKIVGWHLFEARRFLGDVAAPRERSNARRLDAWLLDYCRSNARTQVERRTIQNSGPNPVRSKLALGEALAELVEAGRVVEVEDGRRKLIKINPALFGGSNGAA